MRTDETREIDGVLFRVTTLPFTPARKALVRFVKVLGPGLIKAMDAAGSLEDMADAPPLADALTDLLDRIGDDDLEYFADVFGNVTEYSEDGGSKWPRLTKANREVFFRGRMSLFFQWLRFAFEVQYSDFFSALGSLAGVGLRPQGDPEK